MNGLIDAFYAGRHKVARCIAANHGHIAVLDPLEAGSMQPGGCGGDVPYPLCGPTRPSAGAYENYVATLDFHAGLLFPGIEIFGIDRRRWLEEWNTLEARHVHQDAA